MKYRTSVVVLLAVAGLGRAGEKEEQILQRLMMAGIQVSRSPVLPNGAAVLCVQLSGANADAGLAELCEVDRLGLVCINDPATTDRQVRAACSFRGLVGLNLDLCPVTDAHLKQVGRLDKLQFLSLTGTQVTDAGVEELAGLADLRRLFLDRTRVTDAGLRHLAKLNKLEELVLTGSPGVTDEGVARLKKALPKCEINH